MLETGTKERSWRKVISEVRSSSRREAFQSFFIVDALPGCRPTELHVLVGRLRGVDKPFHALELAPRVLVFAVPLELCQDYVEDVVCDGLWTFRAEDLVEDPDAFLLSKTRCSFFHLLPYSLSLYN